MKIAALLLTLAFATSAGAMPLDKVRALADAPATRDSEKRLEEAVLEIGRTKRNDAAHALLESLADRPPQVWITHEEGSAQVPYVDVAATARFVLRSWRRSDAKGAALAKLRALDPALIEKYLAGDADERAGILDALDDAPADSLLTLRNAAIDRVTKADGGKLAQALAGRLADRELQESVLRNGTSAVVLRALPELARTFGPQAALAMLETAMRRDELASAALFQVGALTEKLPAAENRVWQALGDPRLGATAATIIARSADRHAIEQLELLATGDEPLQRQHALLALRLGGHR